MEVKLFSSHKESDWNCYQLHKELPSGSQNGSDIVADCGGEWDAAQVPEAYPCILNKIEQEKEEHKDSKNDRNTYQDQNNFDDQKDIFFVFSSRWNCIVFLQLPVRTIWNDNATCEQPEHKAANVSKIVNEWQKAE